MGDFNKNFLIKAAELHIGLSATGGDEADDAIIGLDYVDDFVKKTNKPTLYAFLENHNDRKVIKFTSKVPPDLWRDNYDGRIVVFTKTGDGSKSVQITSLAGPPNFALYHTLNDVFAPFLAQSQDENHENVKIQRQVANLQANLRNTLLSSSNEEELSSNFNSLNVIESLDYEVEYWNKLSGTSKNRLKSTSATSFSNILKTISTDFGVLDALPLNDVDDLLENAHAVLDDLWRHEPPYPKFRTTILMDLIAEKLNHAILKHIKSADIWTGDDSNKANANELLTQCVQIGGHWLKSCKELTEIFWPNYPSNPWTEQPYIPESLAQLVERLKEVIKVRILLRQLTRLLTQQERDALATRDMFEPFKNHDLEHSDSSEWLKACKCFEHSLKPAEELVASKLKKQLSSINANTRQLVHEFSRYAELIARPILKQALLTERQQLLTSLHDYMRQLVNSSDDWSTSNKYETPRIVAEVIQIRQVMARVEEVDKVSRTLLEDLNGYDTLKGMIDEHLRSLKSQNTELFDSWTSELSSLIKRDDVLTLKESEPVVQFSSDSQLMRVNYSPRLVTLILEVRQFKALGYHVPSHIDRCGEHAKKFMGLARTLEQIANFHNTIGDRMITCQRPMMLNSALELARLVQEEKVVSWGDTKSVEKYVATLKTAVERLSKENNLLASYYYEVVAKIKRLEDLDLIREYHKWSDTTKQIRGIMTQVEDKGFTNLQNWKQDVDNKLCALLTKQYILSMDTLHLYLPEIYTDIVYRQSQLQFSPPEETLMTKYNEQLSKFLDIPKSFRGVVHNNDTFSKIVTTKDSHLDKVKEHTGQMFDQLHDVLRHWQSWLQIEVLDTAKLTTWQQWELHFRASKTLGQEIAKLPNAEERVGCFCIGLTRLRSDLESHNRSYWDQLTTSLKDSIAEDVVKLQNYIDPSTAMLIKQPVTMKEISETGASHNIIKQIPEMEGCFDEMAKKAQILSSWTREQVDSVNRLKGAWDRLRSLLENHQHIMQKQMETIKTTLDIESENFERDLERFSAKWEQLNNQSIVFSECSFDQLHKHLESIKEKKVQWAELIDKKTKIGDDYDKFNLEQWEFPMVEQIVDDMNRESQSWSTFEEFYSELDRIVNEEWIVFRKKMYRFEDFLAGWLLKLGKETVTPSDLTGRIVHEIHRFENLVPVLKYVRGEDFTDKHWIEVFNLLKLTPPKPLDLLLLKDFTDRSEQMIEFAHDLQAIAKKASSEVIVRQALSELDQWEVQTKFLLTPHNNTALVKDFKEILNKIGDNQSLLQSVKNSADYETFSERAAIWENKLASLEQNLTLLSQIQRKWVYLEPIFGGRVNLIVHEKARFDKIDKEFKHILHFVDKDPRVTSLNKYPSLSVVLKGLQEQLGRCQKSLDKFLQDKRAKFPRFLFLGDDDLLEVVGQSSKEQVIQTHLKKLFAGINSVGLDDSGGITAMCSLEGEAVALSNAVDINTPVEDWLNCLVKEMQKTLKELLVKCLTDGQGVDPSKYPSQILCLSDSITFTLKTEQAIANMTLPHLLAFYKTQMSHYSSLELNTLDSIGEATLELKLKALLMDTIHHIAVIQELLDSDTTKTSDWAWQKQLRFHSNSQGEVTIKMANARMEYSFEYLGNSPKLVRTSLTDRCFLTLTQGMHLGMGGNPYGPAGTGKTESVKALGRLLGRQVLVFNCDKGIDAASMGRILAGLVRTGAWGCFDEFNRLDEATLSAVSMQIHPIQMALRAKSSRLVLLDQDIEPVNMHCGVFVTLNPAGGSYGGRNKLPDNLKQLFRPVVMTQPDHEDIARTLLLCDGYQNADLISKKLVELFSCASQLLSKQKHYDWGLRAIRTILTSCGSALKDYRRNTEEAQGNQLLIELTLIVKVLRVDTMSKLTFSDGLKFDSLIRDTFKDVEATSTGNDSLIGALENSCNDLGLRINSRQIGKCLELYEQLRQRMGVALIGPPSCGKSSIRNLLFHALTKLGKVVLKQHVFNPKSVNKTELLGQIDLDTRQWSDGILTSYSLQVTSEPTDVWSWIVCDGNIDPDWVESLNSVLDDNRLLTLPSGGRVQFGPNVNFIFETHDLSHASPATVSRIGIVLLNDSDLSLDDFVATSCRLDKHLSPHIDDYLLKSITWLIQEGELVIESSTVGIIKTGLSQLRDVKTKSEFVVSLLNGLGQQLQEDFREVFAQQLFEWTGENPPPLILKSRYNRDLDIIDSYYTDANISIDIAEGVPLIETGDVLKSMDVLRKWLRSGFEEHFLIVGPHGSAKSLILKNLVNMDEVATNLATVNCSANLKPLYVINKIKQLCLAVNTNTGKVYKPKTKSGKLVLYFKNLHLLKPDKWGTNVVIEFLNQMITYKAFFDSNLELVGFENITIVGSLSATDCLSKRFTSIVHIYNVNLPDAEDLSLIVISHLSALLRECSVNWPKNKISKLAVVIISIYDRIRCTFQPTQYKHYEFSPHDLTRWCSTILRYKEILLEGPSESSILEILHHEAFTRFCEKLVDNDDRVKFAAILNDSFKTLDSTLTHKEDKFKVSLTTNNAISTLNRQDWIDTIHKAIVQYKRDQGQSLDDLLINTELLTMCAEMSKIVTSSTNGNLVLIGKAGIGRKSSIKIVSALQNARLIHPQSTSQPQFNLDLKNALQVSGLDGQQVYLVLEDNILEQSHVLGLINTLILSGEVPGLYNWAELESITAGLKDDASGEGFEEDLMDFFTQRIKRNLHLIACIDCNNNHIWSIFEQCPALVHNSSIMWRANWSQKTIQQIPETLTDNGVAHFAKLFDVIKAKDSSPYRFIASIKLYNEIHERKRSHIVGKQAKLKSGISKLTDAANLVAALKENAAEQQEKLAEKQSKANTALDMISETMRNANTHREQIETLKAKTEQENVQLVARKQEIELELAEVEPLIQQARSSVGNIKTESLSEIRSLRAPPDIIRDILEGVLRLMGIQDTSWNSMKTFLAKRGVKEEIRSFDASRIVTENRVSVERLIANKKDSFDPKSAKRASVAAAPLADWVVANVKYSHVVDKIRPLEREQNKLKDNLRTAQDHLGELSLGLSDVDATVSELKAQLSSYTKEAAEIEIGLNAAQKNLRAAEELVSKLDDEFTRWREQLKELSDQLERLQDYCCLASAFITYLSDESEEGRSKIVSRWAKETGVGDFDFEQFMSSERERNQWQNEGLSHDTLAIQNAIIILQTKITPLMIDPTSNALKWIKNHFGKSGNKRQSIECVTQDSPKFVTNLELAIRFGKVLIVEDVERISPILLPILRREYIGQGERTLVNLNGKLVDYHNDFTLILSSRNEQLKVSADLGAIVCTMNFTVTHAGLTEQLLSSAIRQENPQLEDRKKQLLREREDLQEKQYQLQSKLLDELGNSTGDILQNDNLIQSLNETKASSLAISTALTESNDIQNKIQSEYNVHYDISKFGSSMYFACNDFTKFNILYTINVTSFTKLFLTTFHEVQMSLEAQRKHVFVTVYKFLTRGIFKKDRLIIAMHLIKKLFDDLIQPNEWNLFLGGTSLGNKDTEPIPNWIPKNLHSAINNLGVTLPDLYQKLQLHSESWRDFMTTNHCDKYLTNLKLGDFEKVLTVQALRPDRLYSTMNQFVLTTTGLKSVDPQNYDLRQIVNESKDPILILTTSGSDPSNDIAELSDRKLIEIAMGEGQETKAIEALKSSSREGCWLILKNLHLVTNWLSILSHELQNLSDHHPDFRVWLITEHSESFNYVLAHNCLKIVYESPQGIRNNVEKTLNNYGAKYMDALSSKSARIFFVLTCLHAILQERRTFIPQGWSKWYEFSDSDFNTCAKLVLEIENSGQIKWTFISGLILDAIYGGKIENDNDMRILASYLREYLKDEVLSHRWSPFGVVKFTNQTPKLRDYLEALRQMPERDLPSFFGLPDNINRAWEKQTSGRVISKLNTIVNKSNSFSNFERRDLWYRGLAPLMTLWKKLNQGHDFIRMNLQRAFADSVVENFIDEEFCVMIGLIQTIHRNVADLNKMCKGGALPEEFDLEIGKSLLNFEVPKRWNVIWEGPKEPGRYLRSIVAKAVQLGRIKQDKSEQQLIGGRISLSIFLNPRGFLSAYKQEYSRKCNIPMDQLELETAWQTSQQTKNSITLTDLLLEGAILEGNKLKDCSPESENINSAPSCQLVWREKGVSLIKDDNVIDVPLYYTPQRDELITSLKIPCGDVKERDKWIQAGVAFYLEN